jgi:hypothetical protein
MHEVWEVTCPVCGEREFVFGCPESSTEVCSRCQKTSPPPSEPVKTFIEGWSWVALSPVPVVERAAAPPPEPVGETLVDTSDLPMSEILLVQGQGGPVPWVSLLEPPVVAAPVVTASVATEPEKPRPRPNIVKVHNFIMSRDNDKESKIRVLDEAIEIASGDDLKWLRKERDRVEGRYPSDLKRREVRAYVEGSFMEGDAVRVFADNREIVKLTTNLEEVLSGLTTASRDTLLFYRRSKDSPEFIVVIDYPLSSPPTFTFVLMPTTHADVLDFMNVINIGRPR